MLIPSMAPLNSSCKEGLMDAGSPRYSLTTLILASLTFGIKISLELGYLSLEVCKGVCHIDWLLHDCCICHNKQHWGGLRTHSQHSKESQ